MQNPETALQMQKYLARTWETAAHFQDDNSAHGWRLEEFPWNDAEERTGFFCPLPLAPCL